VSAKDPFVHSLQYCSYRGAIIP